MNNGITRLLILAVACMSMMAGRAKAEQRCSDLIKATAHKGWLQGVVICFEVRRMFPHSMGASVGSLGPRMRRAPEARQLR
jgi:hypothetical protein